MICTSLALAIQLEHQLTNPKETMKSLFQNTRIPEWCSITRLTKLLRKHSPLFELRFLNLLNSPFRYQVIPFAIQKLKAAGYNFGTVADCLGLEPYNCKLYPIVCGSFGIDELILGVGPPQPRDVCCHSDTCCPRDYTDFSTGFVGLLRHIHTRTFGLISLDTDNHGQWWLHELFVQLNGR